jgi:hypothetical protein
MVNAVLAVGRGAIGSYDLSHNPATAREQRAKVYRSTTQSFLGPPNFDRQISRSVAVSLCP